MDLVNYDQKVFDTLTNEYQKEVAAKLNFKHIEGIQYLVEGDNIISKSKQIDWYKGPKLMRL